MIAKKLVNQSVRSIRRGFTLMEMLVVVAIIVALAGIGGYYIFPRLEEAKMSTAKVQAKTNITNAVQNFNLDNSRYPTSLDELTVPQNDRKPYLERDAIIDPWGHPYHYDPSGPHNEGNKPDVWAEAPNGQQIGNWSN